MASGVHVEGLREAVRSLESLGVEVQDLKTAFTRVSDVVVTRAEALAPKRTGALAASLRPSRTKNKAVVRAGGARVPYAGAINYGWPARGIPASGFLTSAANDHTREYVDLLTRELEVLIRKHNL